MKSAKAIVNNKIKIEAVNEDCFMITFGTKIDLSLTAQIASLNQQIKLTLAHHLIDSTPSYTTILVQFNLLSTAPLVVYEQLKTLVYSPAFSHLTDEKKCHRLPVYYHSSVGPDLLPLAESKGLTVDQVITIHSQQRYQVCALGFSPGFAFLAEVNPLIQQPRLASPRPKVQAGSVAIADKQTAVYPSDSPGGWNIIGHCPMRLFDMEKMPISDFSVGDSVEFYPVNEQTYLALMETEWGTEMTGSSPSIDNKANGELLAESGLRVINSGVLSSIQDKGRFGQSEQGVSQGGVADTKFAHWANYLLGNSVDNALIEITVGGAEFVALSEVRLALTGAEMHTHIVDENNKKLKSIKQQSFTLFAGQRLKLGFATQGVRAYLAVKDGFNVKSILGSCSTVKRNQIGGLAGNGEALKKGDVIALNMPGPLDQTLRFNRRVPDSYHLKPQALTRIGLIESYQQHLFTAQQKCQLYQQTYTISTNSDRMGMRLLGGPLSMSQDGVISEAIALGSVQIPADGVPIILLQDRQTLGGYPKIGCVCQQDLNVLAQLPAGSEIQFYRCSLDDVQQQYREKLRFFNAPFEDR